MFYFKGLFPVSYLTLMMSLLAGTRFCSQSKKHGLGRNRRGQRLLYCQGHRRSPNEVQSQPPKFIGRIDVGTVVGKSKTVKTVLMGGTAALFNAINCILSRSWDGGKSMVVCHDITVYAEADGRPVGGAGACAILVDPNAPVVFKR
ncbi:hydroxymethylglutaryl-coenzyme A synthase N terminal-domain-containing protein [Coprinopsis sp. MPI-PUGE-AT-0042]|nr:hydroxymethylglutaryl-coenzyme A synthase N terminal-domain-containing protein [Coprinopsis sp. MPI-PUGE-AT-0042]